MSVWIAVKNMLSAARRDPIWAIVQIVIAPVRAGRYLLGVVIIAFVGTVLAYGLAMALGSLVGMNLKSWWPLVFFVPAILVVAMVIVRMLTAPLLLHFGDDGSHSHGSARIATKGEIAPLRLASTGLLIGRDGKTKKLLRYDGASHLVTMAPTRTGKGVGTIIPNLLTLDRSVICIDPKGENARITRRARDRFGPVHILDPFGITGTPSSAFNPLAEMAPESLDLAEEAASLADALVFDDAAGGSDAFWNEEARALIAGLILHIVSHEPFDRRTLSTLRAYLTLAPEAFDALLSAMQSTTAANGLVARAANRQLSKADREAASVLSTAQRHTHFLDSPRMTAVLARSDVRFGDLKSRTATVFLVLPPDRLSTYARWLRLMVTQSLQDMTRVSVGRTAKPSSAVLFLLDEFAALGHLAPVERAMGLMAGYGVQLWPILQDIHQLRATYGQRAGTFLSNAGVLQIFGVNDHDSARFVSDLLGQTTVAFQTMGRALDSEKSGISLGDHLTGRPLMTPDEVRNLPASVELLFLAGQRPIVARKLAYYEDTEFRGMFD
jgi:type IV secretion system protein VirD4